MSSIVICIFSQNFQIFISVLFSVTIISIIVIEKWVLVKKTALLILVLLHLTKYACCVCLFCKKKKKGFQNLYPLECFEEGENTL